MEYKILGSNDYIEIDELDKIRVESFNQEASTDYFVNRIKNNQLSAVQVSVDNNVVGGAYVYISPNTYSLNIDRLFILEEYRHNNYASLLLDYILKNKKIFEDIYGIKVNKSIVEPSSVSLIEFYKLNGYKGPNVIGNMTKTINYEDVKKK